jgi:hypothetical protein
MNKSIPKHLLERCAALNRQNAEVGLTDVERSELVLIERTLRAFESAAPMHRVRVAREAADRQKVARMEAQAAALSEQALYLQGLRDSPPDAERKVFSIRVSRPRS